MKWFRHVIAYSDCMLLQNDANKIGTRCLANIIPPNEDETRVICRCRKRAPFVFSYMLADAVTKRVRVVRDLGVYIDRALTFTHYVSVACNA